LSSRPLPTFREMLRHAMPAIIEGSIAPFVVFVVALQLAGMSAALIAALVCAYGAYGWRVMTDRRVSGMLMVSMAMLTIKTIVAAATGSLTVYFVPPVITAGATAAVFLGSAAMGRPLAWKIANDFWQMPDEAIDDPRVQRLFVRMSLMFGAVYITKGALTAWMLLTMPMEHFVVARGVITLSMMATSAVVAMVWARAEFSRMRIQDSAVPVHA
jgi:intracellular septation protein A